MGVRLWVFAEAMRLAFLIIRGLPESPSILDFIFLVGFLPMSLGLFKGIKPIFQLFRRFLP
ncbi:MAG: hypothetical protein DRJ59_06275 [Thermoprotei archaeon]|nr:MAG: hypothetical protein DRJ59_06275 [Thermoprotei archaeon]